MATYTRSKVMAGSSISLRVIFTDANGELADLTATPSVYIYDETFTEVDIQAEIDSAGPYTGSGPFVATRISKGFYEYTYVVPSGAEAGTYFDVWVGTFGGEDATQYLYFAVERGVVLTQQGLTVNEFVVVDLDASIADDDDGTTLGEDLSLSFTTRYAPYYASVEMVRMAIGPFLDFIPDDTLAMMIHWASLEADAVNTSHHSCNDELLDQALERFVIFDAAYRAGMLPSTRGGSGSGAQKTLGDLMIKAGSAASGVAVLSSGIDIETLKWLRDQRDEWWRVVNAGGCIVPGQGYAPTFAKPGINDPDAYVHGRLWDDPSVYHFEQPGANVKRVRPGRRRGTFSYKSNPRSRW